MRDSILFRKFKGNKWLGYGSSERKLQYLLSRLFFMCTSIWDQVCVC